MQLRTRFSAEIIKRLRVLLPQAIEAVWDVDAVVVAIEQIKFVSTGGHDGSWARLVTMSGVLRVELRSDGIDELALEPLIASLVAAPVRMNFDEAVEVGALSERARLTLIEVRDTIRDMDIASTLRFNVEGVLARRDPAGELPLVLTINAENLMTSGAGL